MVIDALKLRRFGHGKWCLGGFLGVALLGVVMCSYGYAAFSTDLLISGEATVKPELDVIVTDVKSTGALQGANEGYNTTFTARTVSLYPQLPNAGGDLVYQITFCNNSTTKQYELTSLETPVVKLQGSNTAYYRLNVGDLAKVGKVIEPGTCDTANVEFYHPTGNSNIVSYQMDFEWTEYNSVPFSIDYMQDMTPQECARVTPREEKMLIDRRDGKKYWVAKLQDGNCWMVQNLAYDLKMDTPLTPEDSDVKSNWTPWSDTNFFKYSATNTSNNNERGLSWNLGDNIMLGQPRGGAVNICRRYGLYGSATFAEKIDKVCAWSGVLDVTGWSPTWEMQMAKTTWPDPSYFGEDALGWKAAYPPTKEYDAHYKIGNYYQWVTATAESGLTMTINGTTATSSICPKGWQLPEAPTGTLTKPKSFANLFRMYGIVNNVSEVNETSSEKNGYGIYWKPFYGTASGYIAPYDGYLLRFMEWGGLWSSTLDGKHYSFNLAFMPNMILRARGGPNEWQVGMPVRCVAR